MSANLVMSDHLSCAGAKDRPTGLHHPDIPDQAVLNFRRRAAYEEHRMPDVDHIRHSQLNHSRPFACDKMRPNKRRATRVVAADRFVTSTFERW
jgi:hypothetical protein